MMNNEISIEQENKINEILESGIHQLKYKYFPYLLGRNLIKNSKKRKQKKMSTIKRRKKRNDLKVSDLDRIYLKKKAITIEKMKKGT